MVEALKMIANVKAIMFPKHVTRLKSVLVCGRVLLIVTLLCTLITQTSPYLARRNVHGLVEFPPTNHVGKQLTRAISRGDPLVASFSNPLPSVVVPSASSNLGIISTGPVASIAVVGPPNTLQRLMTPPPPTTGTSTSTSKSLSYSSKFYSNSDSSKDRYANSFHTGGTGTGASRNFNKPSSKSHFNKKSYVGSPYNEKHESSKRYAMTYHTGPSSTTFPETSTSATFIINDYTNKTSIVRLSQNDNFERKQETLNFQNTVPHSGLTGSPGTFSPQASSLPNTHDHLHNIKQQLLHTAYSNNYAHNSHLNTNQLGTGQYNTNNYHTEYTTQGPSAPPSTGFGARQQEIPTVAAATVGASIQFSQNSAQFPGQNTQQQQQPQFSSSWNQNYNAPNQVAQQRHFQQQPSNQFPTGFDPRAQTRLPWANNNNRLPTEYQRIPPSASASGPTGRYNIPFLHHQLAHPYHHGSASNVRPTGFGNIPPATKSPITPTFGQGTTGSYAAVRDPSEMPAEGRREKVTVPPPQPPQVQTPPPPPVQSSTTLGTTTTQRIQETTEPITSASEAESKFIESSTHRAGNGDGGYGWGPEGASSGGNEEGGIANVFVDIVTSKIKSIQATVNGIQAAIKGAKRSGARKIANKIEGIGTFVHAVTKGVSCLITGIANAL